MNLYMLSAAILMFVLCVAHSVIGERMIFKSPKVELPKKFRGVLWAAWHIGSMTGACLGLILLYWANDSVWDYDVILGIITFCMFVSSGLIVYATKAKHPAWIVFLIIGLLLTFTLL